MRWGLKRDTTRDTRPPAWLHLILDESTLVDPLHAIDICAFTKRNYEDALWLVRERLGARPLQSITKADVEDLVDWVLTAGRRREGAPGTGLSGRTVRLTLGRVQRRAGGGRAGRQARPRCCTTGQTTRAHPARA